MGNSMNTDTLRPRLHFSPNHGWINDPNGLLYYEGTYHLFYQYDPDNTIPVSMHWGHATSRDLVHWQEQPVALYPDDNGVIYSGSMVVDWRNLSRLGNGEVPPLLAFFTYHKEEGNSYSQSQGIAYSCDHGKHFKKYPHNPILTYPQRDFRDPMVFFHEPSKKWVMLLVAGRSVLFYTSADLLQWKQSSSFLPMDAPATDSELWECPCLFALNGPDGEMRWVLVVSVFTAAGEQYGMRYFIGNFNGIHFESETPWDEVRMLDAGWDYYAGAIFNGMDSRVVMMGWLGCWYYARKVPAANCRGSMGMPRELYLAKSAKGIDLAQRFAPEVDQLFTSPVVYHDIVQASLPEGGCRIRLSLIEASQQIRLTNSEETLQISLDTVKKMICVDRCGCSGEYLGTHANRFFTACYVGDGELLLDIILDINSLELLMDGGKTACTMQYYARTPLTELNLDIPARSIHIHADAKCEGN